MCTKNPSFIVDLSSSMVISNVNDESKNYTKGQILYCKCGNVQKFNGKLVRNVIKNYDELTEDSESLSSITCTSCDTIYDNLEKLYLLEPNLPELYSVNYTLENKEDNIFVLSRVKGVVEYVSSKEGLVFSESIDFLRVDLTRKASKITLKEPYSKSDISFLKNQPSNKTLDYQVDKSNKKNVFENQIIDIRNVSLLEEFFSYSDSVVYSGFENILKSLDLTKVHIKDLDKFDSVYFIDFIKSKSKIQKETDSDGVDKYCQSLDSGFGDGKIVKKNLNLGDYLFNSMNSYKLLISILSFENSSCIIHTKGYNFFKLWTESNYIHSPEVYSKKNATNPALIMAVSISENERNSKTSSTKSYQGDNFKDSDLGFLKISATIYNSIKLISHLDTLRDIHYYKLASKNQIEFLLQNYKYDRVYNVLSRVLKNNSHDIDLGFKNIKHMLDSKMDESSSDFVTIYKDTVRVVDLLDVKPKVIYKCKDYDQLKDLHDDYSSRYNAMKDAKKSEFYSKAVLTFKDLNTQVGDVKFEVVDTAERLNLEGLQMHHCIYTYLDRICDKKYIAINVTHLITKERATAGFVRTKDNTIELEQLKGYYNSRATKELIDSTFAFCHENNINSKNTYSSDMTSDKSRERMMPGQMSESELFKLRTKNGDVLNNDLKDNGNSEKSIVKNIIKKIFK